MTAKEQREARLAAQLRENLKRRKAAARAGEVEEPACSREDDSPVGPLA